MGVVYRSTHPRLEIPVAIKVLAEQYSSDPNFRQRFHREAATVAALNHPGIVRVYDFDEDGPVLFIVMEWVEGRSMRSWLDEYGRFSVDVSVDLVQQLLSAVGVAHDLGVVHRDIKPDNILISNRGKTKILDFGISKLVDDKQRLTATGSMVGTPAYMAPEQVKGGHMRPWSYHFVTPAAPLQPKSDAKGYYTVTALGPDLMENAQNAVRDTIGWLTREKGLSREDAYILCSLAGDLRISQIVDQPNWGVSFYLAMSVFN